MSLLQQKFLLHKTITSNFIATSCINYCNDFNIIAMIFFIEINIFSCDVYISFFDFLNQKKNNQVPFLLMVVDILMQIYAQDILNERLEALKLKKFPNLHQPKNIALLDFDFASFHQPLANDDVTGFEIGRAHV